MTADTIDLTQVWYHGLAAAGRGVIVEDAAGELVGVLANLAGGRPDDLTWGYGGGGPADTARSLLLAALGDAGRCPDCAGTNRIAYDPEDESGDSARPYDPARAPAEYAADGLTVSSSCWRWNCDGGWLWVPHEDFKQQFVAGWGPGFRIGRGEILAWLDGRIDTDENPAGVALIAAWKARS